MNSVSLKEGHKPRIATVTQQIILAGRMMTGLPYVADISFSLYYC